MEATTQFIHSAPGRAREGAMPSSAMTARYPVAPPWPTDAYKNATAPMAASKTALGMIPSSGTNEG